MADGGQHPAHLAIASFINGQLDLGHSGAAHIFFAVQETDIFGGPGQAVIEHDAFPQTLQLLRRGDALHLHPIRLRHMVTRMRQLVQKVAVIGQKDQALAVGVQTPHRAQHRLAPNVYKFGHKTTGMGIGP